QRDAAGGVRGGAAVHRAAGGVPAAAQGRFGGGAAGAAAAGRGRHRRPRPVLRGGAGGVRPAPQDPAQRAVRAVRRGRPRSRRDRSRGARGAAVGGGVRPPGERSAGGLVQAFTRGHYTVCMDETPDYTLEIQIATRFVDEESEPEREHYVFAYTIRIRNLGRLPAQLLGRHWIITDGNGKVEEVR